MSEYKEQRSLSPKFMKAFIDRFDIQKSNSIAAVFEEMWSETDDIKLDAEINADLAFGRND